MIDEHSAVVY